MCLKFYGKTDRSALRKLAITHPFLLSMTQEKVMAEEGGLSGKDLRWYVLGCE